MTRDAGVRATDERSLPRLPFAALIVGLALRVGVPLLAWVCGTAPGFFFEPDTRAYVLTSESLLATGRFERAAEPEIFRTPG